MAKNTEEIYKQHVRPLAPAERLRLIKMAAVIIVRAISATEDTETTEETFVFTGILCALCVLCGRICLAMAETTIKAKDGVA